MAGRRLRRARARRLKITMLMTIASVALIFVALAVAALAARGGSGGSGGGRQAARLPPPTLMRIEGTGATPEVTWSPSAAAETPKPSEPPTAAPDEFATVEPDRPATAAPSQAATAAPTRTAETGVLVLTAGDYLPVYKKLDTDEKVIAVTVDDLYQSDNTKTIVDLAVKYGAKLTLFPIGENAIRKEMRKTLRYAYEQGMEIENHTYQHLGLYKLDDEEMARQMYMQALAVDYALGLEYQQHFFRPYGGDGLDDQRTHLYAKQMGMLGIAYWSVSASDTPADKLLGTLGPGNVYLFHSTDSDTKKLKSFIPAAVKAGYRIVTLNELFGLPDNEAAELVAPVGDRAIPAIAPYRLAPRVYQKGDFLWAVNVIQQRLIELGYLRGNADGVFGKGTVEAVKRFQADNGLPVTGMADIQTQEALFPADLEFVLGL